jgi:hypothetical protein
MIKIDRIPNVVTRPELSVSQKGFSELGELQLIIQNMDSIITVKHMKGKTKLKYKTLYLMKESVEL